MADSKRAQRRKEGRSRRAQRGDLGVGRPHEASRADAEKILATRVDASTPAARTATGMAAPKMPHASDASSWASPAKGQQGHGKYLAAGSSARPFAASHHSAFSEGLGAFSLFGIDPEQDRYDALDLYAQHVIDMLLGNQRAHANLTRFERYLLYRYFYKTNPIIARILDLHTDLPLSKVRLQAPADLPGIAKDYVMQFFEKLLGKLKFADFLRELVLDHNVYGEAVALVDDGYDVNDEVVHVLQDVERLSGDLKDYSEEDTKYLEEVERAYDLNPKSVPVSARASYLRKRFQFSPFEPDYHGPDSLRVLPFWRIAEYQENDDVGYYAVDYQISESLETLLQDSATADDALLTELGYSPGMLALLRERREVTDRCIEINSDDYEGLPYIFRMRRPEGSSLILRILNEALSWEAAQRATRSKIETTGMLGRIISAEGLSDEQTGMLRVEVNTMLEDPTYAIVANFPVEWTEVNALARDQLTELVDMQDKLTEVIATGEGMPMSLISGDSQYSGTSIKLEILNVEYHNFKGRVSSLIEERLFKPVALRKGLVVIDDWGNPTLCYPRLTFSRVSLRDESVFDILFSLYQKGSLPVSVIYDILNLDPDDTKRGVEQDLFTVNDPNFNELVRGIITSAADPVFQQSDVADRLMRELRLKPLGASAPSDPGAPATSSDPDADDLFAPGTSDGSSGDASADPGAPAAPAPPAPGSQTVTTPAAPTSPIPTDNLQPSQAPSMDDSPDPNAWSPPPMPSPETPAHFDLQKAASIDARPEGQSYPGGANNDPPQVPGRRRGNQQFHETPQHLPPSPNRKPRLLPDPDLDRDVADDPDLRKEPL